MSSLSSSLSLSDNSFWWAPGWLQGANRSGQSTPCGRFLIPALHSCTFTFSLSPLILNQAAGNVLVLEALLFSLPGWQADYYWTSGQSINESSFTKNKTKTKNLNSNINKIKVTNHRDKYWIYTWPDPAHSHNDLHLPVPMQAVSNPLLTETILSLTPLAIAYFQYSLRSVQNKNVSCLSIYLRRLLFIDYCRNAHQAT